MASPIERIDLGGTSNLMRGVRLPLGLEFWAAIFKNNLLLSYEVSISPVLLGGGDFYASVFARFCFVTEGC